MIKGGGSDLDAVIIADYGLDTLSGTNPLKLELDGRVGDIQVIRNYVENTGRIVAPVRGDDLASWSSAPRLNGLYLYSFLTKNNFHVELIDNFTTGKARFETLTKQQPRAVIISTSFIFFKRTLRALAAEIRAIVPDIHIIAGGPFITYSHLLLQRSREKDYETEAAADDFLFLRVDREPAIDFYITSPRGEQILARELRRLRKGELTDLPGNTARLTGSTYFFGPVIDDVTDAAQPEISWDLLPASTYRAGVLPLQASNGCPYACAFCNFSKDRRFTFVKPLDQLIRELQVLERLGTRYVWFVDDNFRLGRHDLNEVCRSFIDHDISVQWMCFVRASTLERCNINLLRRAGCIEVQIGLESGDPGMLANMNKKADPAMYVRVIRELMEHGINVSCYFIAGFPGETEETAAITREFIKSIENPDTEGSLSWSIYPFLLTPLSPVYEPSMRQRFGLTGYMGNWSHDTMDYHGAKQLVKKAFFALENSGPIYRGDNLDMLREMDPAAKNRFYRIRHALSKQRLTGGLTPKQVIGSFSDLIA